MSLLLDLPATSLEATPMAPPSPATPLPPATHPPSPIPDAPGATSFPPTRLLATPDARPSAGTTSHIAALRLELAAAMLDDLEQLRIATENRVRSATGYGLPAGSYEDQLAALQAMEHRATLDLQRALRLHPLAPWVKATVGIGEKQGARLIAAIGDPAWNTAEDRPRRGPAELWAYCGYAPGQQRRKGVKSNWNANAKMRAHLCAVACIKQSHSPYRPVYDAARASWAGRDVTAGHAHNHALRLVAKAILRDLWRAAS